MGRCHVTPLALRREWANVMPLRKAGARKYADAMPLRKYANRVMHLVLPETIGQVTKISYIVGSGGGQADVMFYTGTRSTKSMPSQTVQGQNSKDKTGESSESRLGVVELLKSADGAAFLTNAEDGELH
ncbi:hypothetical protein PSHT_06794 [Puccinia striiformis]|uniref:Uncharacterized protein n=1 Tax=Puccinia striiformis TaxID=27350 RepID=A0A2S4W343_9BASI|nr:hypothetical protein PSHT_06794 [Puccinia striiformis]